MIGAVQIACLAEGVAIAEQARLDLALVAETIATGQAASPQVVRNSWRTVDDEHEFARTLGIASPFGEFAASQLRRVCDFGHTRANESKIIEVARLQTPRA